MEKIPTLFLRNPENMKLVTREVNPEAAWVFGVEVMPSVKRDGSPVRVHVDNGQLIMPCYKRRNPSREEKAKGAEPGWVEMHADDPADRHLWAAINSTDFSAWPNGAWPCEALGPKIQGGIECFIPMLYPFSWNPEWIEEDIPLTYDGIKAYLETHEIEGIVWHEQSNLGRMCKIKRRDFGLSWPVRQS